MAYDGKVSGLDEPAHVTELRNRSDAVRALVVEEVSADPGDDLVHLVGLGALVDRLRRMAPSAKRVACVLQPTYFYDPEDPGVELAQQARERGVETDLITRPAALRTHPLLPSIFPTARLGPVFLRAMVVDEEQLIVEGPDTADGERTSWYTTRPAVIGDVVDLWHLTCQLSRPILPPGAEPPLSERQLEVCRLLAVGEKDQVIARTLGTSARTVERDVHTILHELGASSRTEAVLLMRGRGVNGGWPEG